MSRIKEYHINNLTKEEIEMVRNMSVIHEEVEFVESQIDEIRNKIISLKIETPKTVDNKLKIQKLQQELDSIING
jgi:hypothetical protein